MFSSVLGAREIECRAKRRQHASTIEHVRASTMTGSRLESRKPKHRSKEQRPRPSTHVLLIQPGLGLVDREQAAIEAVAYDALEMVAFEFGCQIDDRAQ